MAEVGDFIIPQFKEKTIYWMSGVNQFSYPVSSSFRGILRISPNDSGSLLEKNSSVAFGADETLDVYYKDVTEDDLEQQFLRTSTSDGYFIDLRFTKNQVEFDNLYVIGPSFQSKLRVYTKNDEAIVIDKINCLPSKVNESTAARAIGNYESLMVDYVDTDVHNDLDQTYVLMNRNIQNKRTFDYERISSVIKELIMESLLDLQTVPTGCIQYVPVNLEQYTEMLKLGKPNEYYMTANKKVANDPIIRDYLICDGSLYRNKDFPELSKILRDQKITYWEYDPEKDKEVKKEWYNNSEWIKTNAPEHELEFRVPDLRRMFIKSVVIPEDLDLLDSQPWSETGNWMNDNRPMLEENMKADKHRHFVASAHYQSNPNLSEVAQVASKHKETGEWVLGTSLGDPNPKPGVLAPKNMMNYWKECGFGVWYNPSRYSLGCAEQRVPANTCGYFLSIPQDYDFQNPFNANIGLSSEDITSCVWQPVKDDQISYNERTEYTQYVGTGADETYGKENAPEFCAMLPIIHI